MVSPSITLTTLPRMVFCSLYHDKGMSFAVLYCRNGNGITAAVAVDVDDEDDDTMEEEGKELIILSDANGGSDGFGSTTLLLLNNIDAANDNEMKLFSIRAGKSILLITLCFLQHRCYLPVLSGGMHHP